MPRLALRCGFDAFRAAAADDRAVTNAGGDFDAVSGAQSDSLIAVWEGDFQHPIDDIHDFGETVAANGITIVRAVVPGIRTKPFMLHLASDVRKGRVLPSRPSNDPHSVLLYCHMITTP